MGWAVQGELERTTGGGVEVQVHFGPGEIFLFSQQVNNAYIAYFTMTCWVLTSQFSAASCTEEVLILRPRSLTTEKAPSLLSPRSVHSFL